MTLIRPFSRHLAVGAPGSPGTPGGPGSSDRRRRGVALLADAVVLGGVLCTLGVILALSHGLVTRIPHGASAATISTDLWLLPYYAARSLLRMFAALAASLIFTFVYATLAARSRRLGAVLIPILDILQSVPVLGFLSVTLSVWLTLFPGSELGLECASVFAIFTSQAWNMAFSFWQSLKSEPRELDEAARLMRLTRWERFWRLDVPNGMIPLVWNGMMSFGGGWFFLVASEMITVNNHAYALPGIGSFVGVAASEGDYGKILAASAVMVLMVVGVNFLFWRPITSWAERFRNEQSTGGAEAPSFVYELLRRSRVPGLLGRPASALWRASVLVTRPFGRTGSRRPFGQLQRLRRPADVVYWVVVAVLVALGLVWIVVRIQSTVGVGEVAVAFGDGLLTMGRVAIVLVAGTLVWVPVGVWIGMNPRVTRIAQPIVQVFASFPANFLFPIVTAVFVATRVSLDWGGILLMSLGAQWYILFNVIAGASAIPSDLREAATDLGMRGRLRWKALILPAILPAYVVGALTAAGGAWNASIVSEVVSFGTHDLRATGLGAYIADATTHGDSVRILIGVAVMSVFVVGLNEVLWRPLARRAAARYSV